MKGIQWKKISFKNFSLQLPQPIPASKRKISAISTQETEFIKAPIKKLYPSMKASEVIMHVPGQNANEGWCSNKKLFFQTCR